ncbi:hypothetical protein Tco_0269797 [Tanacetum coccineum]
MSREPENPTREAGKPTDSIPVGKPGTSSYEGIQINEARSRSDWDKQIAFWLDPKNLARAAQNARNQAKSTVICRQGSRSLAVLRDISATREYPSLIQTYFDTHTVDGVFLRDEERLLYEEMSRLKDLGPNTTSGVPYTDDEIMAISQHEVGSRSGSGGDGDDEPDEDEDADEDEDVDGDVDS